MLAWIAAAITMINTPLEYPASHRSDVVDVYHGVRVADPYRWLEDANSPEVRDWVNAQNRTTDAYLSSIPERAEIREKLKQALDYERIGGVLQRGGRLFYLRNTGLQDQSVLYVREPGGEPRVLIDPNTLSDDGTVALSSWSPSNSGRLLAYALARSGSDWLEWRIKDVETGEDRADLVVWSKFSGASWTKDDAGFFYSAYDKPVANEKLQQKNLNQKLYFHRLGDTQDKDALVYSVPEHPDWFVGGSVSDDGRWLVVYVSDRGTTNNRMYLKDLGRPDLNVEPLFANNDAQYGFVGSQGDNLYILTNRGAPNQKVVRMARSAPETWVEVVPESKETIADVSLFGDRLYVTVMQDAKSVVRTYTTAGKRLDDLELPGLGSVAGLSGRQDDEAAFFIYTDYLTPASVVKLSTQTGAIEPFFTPKVAFDPSQYEAKQAFYKSKDGTRIPIYIVSRKGIALDGSHPTLLYGYGGFDISLTPYFSALVGVWLELGGVYAVANLRGGGEYGQAWHDAGRKLHKQNVFDDFIAGAEWLISQGYTRKDKLAIQGGSNGGLLVGAAITQRPDLFGAALPAVGVMDMLRFNKFTIGYAWEADYGSPENEEEFRALLRYSPLHNLRPGTHYPPTLITTADTDDRVVPAHSYKFAAAIQHAQRGSAPVLLRVETSAGHGAGNALSKVILECTDEWGFLFKELGMSKR